MSLLVVFKNEAINSHLRSQFNVNIQFQLSVLHARTPWKDLSKGFCNLRSFTLLPWDAPCRGGERERPGWRQPVLTEEDKTATGQGAHGASEAGDPLTSESLCQAGNAPF